MRICARAIQRFQRRQFPSSLLTPKPIPARSTWRQMAMAAFRSVPLIERFENVNLMPAEMKSRGHRHSAVVSMLLDVNTHFWFQGTFEANASSAQLLSAVVQASWQGLRSVCRC